MRRAQQMVREFQVAMGLPVHVGPPRLSNHALRARLIREEAQETLEAIEANDLVEAADGLADLVYVILGSAVEWGIDLQAVLEEVHRSNCEKLWPDGKPRLDANGKVIKPPGWTPPDIAGVLGVR